KVVTGIDDHSRFVVCAAIVARATSGPVCAALRAALAAHGVPEQILTDNGKVFTARFGPGPGPVAFDRICTDNGIKHLLTAPYSPTTTGKVERLHKTMRREHFTECDRRYATVAQAQAALDAWVQIYNTTRPHQALGGGSPIERFRLAAQQAAPVQAGEQAAEPIQAAGSLPEPDGASSRGQGRRTARPPGITRWVDQHGRISLAGATYRVGPVFAGELVEVVAGDGLVEVLHRGVLVATHVQRARSGGKGTRAQPVHRARAPSTGPVVTRVADRDGGVSFAGTMYQAGRAWARRSIQVSIVAGSVQLSVDEVVIRVHPIRHDRAKEHGAFATPGGRPRKPKPKPKDLASARIPSTGP
ncbi:integrase core domain-containing protein, partial [Nonomuraea sp. NPDC059007]|uniref:integrase core domain-containing protein n=1 Tax=Nonomuraea sp. NPDC059007 TaxID=3346692 RepID=UPI00367AC709